jgi:serine/threonine-protein kinase
VARLDAVRLKRATLVEGNIDLAGADGEYEEMFREAGMAGVGADEEAAAEWVTAQGARDALVAALDDWACCARSRARRGWALRVARRVDPDPWRDRARDPAAWDDASALARLAADERAAAQSPHLLAALGARLKWLGGDARPLMRAAQAHHPGDFWVNFTLGSTLSKEDPVEAVGYYRAALALRPGTALVHNNLGNALNATNRPEEAIAEFRNAIEIDPRSAMSHYNLGSPLACHQSPGRGHRRVQEGHRQACRKLWADVDAFLRKMAGSA